MLKRCKRCVTPNSRPEQVLDDNDVCNACLSFEIKKKIDWQNRKRLFLEEISEAKKSKINDNWDCIIPSSGGKDSTAQAFLARDLGLNPLIVTATTCDLSKIGRKNIENLKNSFDTIEISPQKKIRSKLNKICLETIGDISWAEHVSIFTQPIQIAAKFDIKLILYGEQPQFEYGGPERLNSNIMDRKWMEEFGGFLGFRVSDLINHYGFKEEELLPYIYPDESLIKKKKIKALFMGYYINWNNQNNFNISKSKGFTAFHIPVEGTNLSYEKIDNYQHGIHDYFKYLKYGFSRSTDQASWMIRQDIITREEGIKLVKENDGKYPSSYLGKQLKDILSQIDLTLDEFNKICDKFTNKEIFKCNQAGELIKDEEGRLFLVNDGF
jgi:N-acetyl sugar amidotransferase